VFNSITTGASNDLQRATDLAEQMVTTFGMSKILGPLAYQQGTQPRFLTDGMPNPRRTMSEETAQAIDREVKEIVETAHQQALETIKHNRDLLETITMQLLETEAIEGEKLHQLLSQVQAVSSHAESNA